MVETIAQALKLPYAAIALPEAGQPAVVAAYPGPAKTAPPPTATILPLTYQGEPAGQLLLAPRAPDAPFSVADQRLLSDVARQVGVVAHAVQLQRDLQQLAGDLQQARERLVVTREEERRRLRRDLHDGLGPSLASLTFKLDAARSLMTRDPARADALLSTAADQMQGTVAADPRARVLMLTMLEDDDSVFAALRAGARGYLLKGARQDEALRAIRAVANGEAIFGPVIAQRMAQYFAVRRPATASFPELTEREREILGLIAQGRSNAQIAGDLVVSLKTVRNHVSTIFNKLQVADRAQAMAMARRGGLW